MGRGKQGKDLKGLIWFAKEFGLYSEDNRDQSLHLQKDSSNYSMYGEWTGKGQDLEKERQMLLEESK